jgi:hypothetical protein
VTFVAANLTDVTSYDGIKSVMQNVFPVIEETANYNGVLGSGTGKFSVVQRRIDWAKLTDDNFTVTGLDAVTEDGKAHAASVTITAPGKGWGEYTVYYTKDGVSSEEAPSEPGEYVVTVDVAQGQNYRAYTYSAGTLTIKVKEETINGLQIVSSKEGFVSGAPWFGAFPNQWIYLTAIPNYGYVFDGWKITGAEYNEFYNTVSFFMPASGKGVKVEAIYRKLVSSNISISSDNGFVSGLPFGNSVVEGTPIFLTAFPNYGYVSDGWEIDGVDYNIGWGGSISFTMPANAVSVKAKFKTLTFYKVTDSTKDGYVTGLPFGNSALEGTDVYLTPVANFGYQFKEWKITGATVTKGFGDSVSFKLTSDVKVEAVFEKIPVQQTLPGFGFGYGAPVVPGFGLPSYGLPSYGFGFGW